MEKVIILYLPLRQGFFGKKRFNDRSKGFPFGQQPVKYVSLRYVDLCGGRLLANASKWSFLY
ncbi:MAG: hypothetical protein JSW12_20515 [Deltaproteobacteria bacterium]|nr:MAG: hypothetical protein JSW12_20515 [Deltaproteobacteria bacterium]